MVTYPAPLAQARMVAAACPPATRHRGLARYLTDGEGSLRHHVGLFVDGEQLPRSEALATPLDDTSHVVVVQAFAGG